MGIKPKIIIVGNIAPMGFATAMQIANLEAAGFLVGMSTPEELAKITPSFEELATIKNYKGNPFDKPPINIKALEFEYEGFLKPKEHFESPKSKYINKPLRNFRTRK